MTTQTIDTGIPNWINTQRAPDATRGVPCPHCGGDTGVIDSRPRKLAVRRRRVCFACKQRFTTFEIAIDNDPADAAKLFRQQAGALRLLAARIEAMAGSGGEGEC